MYVNLLSELARNKISQEQLAKLLGVNRNTMSNKMNGKTDFTITEMKKIQTLVFNNEHNLDYLFKR